MGSGPAADGGRLREGHFSVKVTKCPRGLLCHVSEGHLNVRLGNRAVTPALEHSMAVAFKFAIGQLGGVSSGLSAAQKPSPLA